VAEPNQRFNHKLRRDERREQDTIMAPISTTLEQPHELVIPGLPSPDGREPIELVFLSAIAILTPPAQGHPDVSRWAYYEPHIVLGGRWRELLGVLPFVTIASIGNDAVANNAGWAIDRIESAFTAGLRPDVQNQVRLSCTLAVRDTDGWAWRLAASAVAIGRGYERQG
jgi:hypothetical protein